jgi:hypothetical protein
MKRSVPNDLYGFPYDFDYQIVKTCAVHNIKMLRYISMKNNDKIDMCMHAAFSGSVKSLMYMRENGYEWNVSACTYAAFNGYLECLMYAIENGCRHDIDRGICSNAAVNGHIDCLKYAHENGCFCNEHTCACAASGGHIDCLIYLHENNCPWNKNTLKEAESGYRHYFYRLIREGYSHKDAESMAMKTGYYKCIEYAKTHGCPRY